MQMRKRSSFSVVLVLVALNAPFVLAQELPRAVIRTDFGDIEIEIDMDRAPITASNFLRYVDGGFYDGGSFFRAVRLDNQPGDDQPLTNDNIKIEVIQAEIDSAKQTESFAPILLERTSVTGIHHQNGTVSMARSQPNTATSSFFIVLGDHPSLDHGGFRNPDGQGFAAFGRVVSGMDVVREIQQNPTQAQTLTPPVQILAINRVKGEEPEPSNLSGHSPYRILVTNDDGIESAGLQTLAKELGRVGEVVVVAPCGDRSGSSMSVSLREEVGVRMFGEAGDQIGHCAKTTPAGAVLLGLRALGQASSFDLVVSGINRGANVGEVSHISGTIGAAMMAAAHGIPAVAVSQAGSTDFSYAARFVTKFVVGLREHAPRPGIVFSINVPRTTEADTEGVLVTPMGGSYIEIGYDEVEAVDGERKFRPRFDNPRPYPEGSDSEAYTRGFITITPLRFDWTAHELVEDLREWGLTHHAPVRQP